MKFSDNANFGKCNLMHYGADTFMGHQEIMGIFPRKPSVHPFQEKVDIVAEHLQKHGHKVEFVEKVGLRYIVCDQFVTVADNLEADPGMCYNVTAPLDYISFEKECEIGKLVREVVTVGRVIVFGGTGNSMQDLRNAEEVRNGQFIGIASAKSGSYKHNYHCIHLGYGVDKNVQVPTILHNHGIPVVLIGKVADIVANEGGKSISCVPTEECMRHTNRRIRSEWNRDFFVRIFRRRIWLDHAQNSKRYLEILKIADNGIGELLKHLKQEDILIIMADHGNDPDIGCSRHTRENVPLLLVKEGIEGKNLGTRETLSDVGASVCDYFGVESPQNGTSFLKL